MKLNTKKRPSKSHSRTLKRFGLPLFGLTLFASGFIYLLISPPQANAAIYSTINFQGKVVNTNGTNIADGTYNMQFKLYTGGNGVVGGGDETLQWTEERLRNNSQGVSINDGIFQVNLGSITSLPDIFNNDTVWLSMNLGNTNATCTPFSNCSPDGEMNPMIRMTAAPYALNSDKLGGLTATNFVQLAQGLQTDASTTQASIAINKTGGTANILTLQRAGADVLAIDTNGVSTFSDDVTLSLAGTENLELAHDLAGTINVLSVAGTPNASANTAYGLYIDQVDSANGNGFDASLVIDNSDTNLAIADGLLFINAGGGFTRGLTFAGATTDVTTTGNEELLVAPGGTGVLSLSTANTTAAALNIDATAGGIDLDVLTGLTFDVTSATAASNISVAANADAEDLTIAVTGSAGDLILNSADQLTLTTTGGAANSLVLTSTNGGIDIITTGSAAGEDIDISAGGSSVRITSTEFVADAIVLDASNGGIDIGANGGAIDIIASGGNSIHLIANEAINNAISLASNADASGIMITAGDDLSATLINGNDIELRAEDDLILNLTAAGQLRVDAATNVNSTVNSATDGTIAFNIDSLPASAGANNGLYLDYEAIDDANANQTQRAFRIDLNNSSNDAADTIEGLSINNVDNAANTAVDSLIALVNSEASANTVTDGLIISGTAGAGLDTIVDAIDVSDDNITNGINLGTNFLVSNGSSINNFAGIGLEVTSNAVGIDLLTAQDGSGSTFSFSGFEFQGGSSDELTLLQGCADNQILKWDDETGGNGRWDCAADATGGGSADLDTVYTNDANQTMTVNNAAGLTFDFTGSGAGGDFVIEDDNTLGLVFDTNDHHLKVYENTASPTNYLDIYYDNATSTGIIAVSSGTVAIGSGSGPITIEAGSGAAITMTANAASTWSTSAGLLTIGGAGGLTLNSTGANALTIDSTTTGAINIGTNANAKTVTLGNTTGATALNFNSGTGGINLTPTGTGNVLINLPGTGDFTIQDAGTDIFEVNDGGLAQLVQNNSIEVSTSGWSGVGTTGVSVSDTTAQYGIHSLLITGSGFSGDGARYLVPLKSGTQYSLSVWVRQFSGSANVLNIGYLDTAVTNCLTGQTLSATWTQYTCTFTPDADGSSSDVRITQSDGIGRSIYVDGLSLVESSSALTFDAGGNNFNLNPTSSGLTFNNTNSATLLPWQLNNEPLTAGLRHAGTATSNGYMYMVGGCTGACGSGTDVATVYYSRIASSGAVGVWNTTTVLPDARYGHTTFTANGYIFVIGGDNGAGAQFATPQTTVYSAKLNNDGTVGSWRTNANALPAARVAHSSIFNNGFAYVIGGDNGGAQSTVYYAKVYADGSTGTWNTTLALTAGGSAVRYASAVAANGYMYVVGGDVAGTAQDTVYRNVINADGTVGPSNWQTTFIPAARRHLTTVVANGYMYVIGGHTSSAQTSVYYAKLLSTGLHDNFINNTSLLPEGRYGHASTVINGYVYVLGGYDGANAESTVLYSSGARTQIGGSLDLVGLSSQFLSDPGGAGAISAGNIRAIGGLQVEGFADINGGLAVDGALNINAVSADAGQSVFNINNSSSNSIFNVQHMSSAFGSLVTAGAFLGTNSFFQEEWNNDATAALTADNALQIGDNGGTAGGAWYFDTTGTTVTYSVNDNVSGFARLATGTTTGVAGLIGFGSAQNNLSTIWLKANLPVVQAKFRVGSTASTNDVVVGLSDVATATATNDTLPTNGIFFWGNNGTSWVGVVRSGGANVGTVTCTGAGSISTTQFAVGRIVVESATSVRFLIDVDASNGVNFTDCGVVSGANPTAALGFVFYAINTTTTSVNNDIDYVRIWQDDVSDASSSAGNEPPLVINQAETQFDGRIALNDVMTTSDNPSYQASMESLILSGALVVPEISTGSLLVNSIEAATHEYIEINEDVVISGTLTVDKIKANQIEGLEVLAGSYGVLPADQTQSVGGVQGGSESGNGPPVAPEDAEMIIDSAAITLNLSIGGILTANGGLVVNGLAQFNGESIFDKLVTFKDAVEFEGRTTLNNDAGGFAVVRTGQTEVEVLFDKEYDASPVISLAVRNGQFVQYAYTELKSDPFDPANTKIRGFKILLSAPAATDTEFSWTAQHIKDPRTAQTP